MIAKSVLAAVTVLACQAAAAAAATTSCCDAASTATVTALSVVTQSSTMTWTGGPTISPPSVVPTDTAAVSDPTATAAVVPDSPGTVVTAGASHMLPNTLSYSICALLVGALAWHV